MGIVELTLRYNILNGILRSIYRIKNSKAILETLALVDHRVLNILVCDAGNCSDADLIDILQRIEPCTPSRSIILSDIVTSIELHCAGTIASPCHQHIEAIIS